jgi:O-antigen ligase
MRLRAALFAGPVIYTLLNAGLFALGFERLEVAEVFNWDIKNVMLGLFGVDAIVPFYPLSAAPRSLAIVAGASTIICLAGARMLHSILARLALYAAAAASFVVILTTDSRMAVVAVIVALAGQAALRVTRTEKLLQLVPPITPLFPLIILQVAVLVAVLDVSDALSRQRFDNISTLSGRSELWEFVFTEVADPKPIHLIGYGQFGQVTAGLGAKYSYIFNEQNGDITRKTAHNMVLQTFLDIGYIGVVVFLMLLYQVTRVATQVRSAHNRLYAQLLIMIFVFGITSAVPTLMSIEISTFFFVFVGMFTSQYVMATNTSKIKNGNPLVRSSWAQKLSP